MKIPSSLITSRNLFIYFDYEREFGGHNTVISDKDIREILRILDSNDIKSTWFTVGKVFRYYPESVREVISKGQEVGSHTYSHIAPLDVACSVLKDDFMKFRKASLDFNTEIAGFHSPNSRWSLKMLKYLRYYNFKYDLVYCKRNKVCNTLMLGRKNKYRIIRFKTVGDDWPVYGKDLNTKEVLDHFKGLLPRINKGEIAGIGFHPWILFSDKRILDGFILFLDYIVTIKGLCIRSAKDFVVELAEN